MRVGKVVGDLEVEAGSRVEPEGPEGIHVEGTVTFQGPAVVTGSITCRSLSHRGGLLMVEGDVVAEREVETRRGELQVRGRLQAHALQAHRTCIIGGALTAETAEIGGHLEVGGPTTLRSLEAGGSIDLRGNVDAESIEVGGRILLSQGSVRRSLEVGGHLEVRGPLNFGSLEAGGKIELKGPCQGESVEVGGALEVDGDLTLSRTLEVGGMAKVRGRLKATGLEIGGMYRGGALSCQRIEVGGSLEVDREIDAERLEVGGSLRAERCTVSHVATLGGRVVTKTGLRSARVEIGEDSRVQGPLVGGTVVLEDGASAEDVWGDVVRLERKSRVRNVYAKDLEIARKAAADGQVQYTGGLRADPDARFASPPQHVTNLPKAPL